MGSQPLEKVRKRLVPAADRLKVMALESFGLLQPPKSTVHVCGHRPAELVRGIVIVPA